MAIVSEVWSPRNGLFYLNPRDVQFSTKIFKPSDPSTFPSIDAVIVKRMACELITGSGFVHIQNPKYLVNKGICSGDFNAQFKEVSQRVRALEYSVAWQINSAIEEAHPGFHSIQPEQGFFASTACYDPTNPISAHVDYSSENVICSTGFTQTVIEGRQATVSLFYTGKDRPNEALKNLRSVPFQYLSEDYLETLPKFDLPKHDECGGSILFWNDARLAHSVSTQLTSDDFSRRIASLDIRIASNKLLDTPVTTLGVLVRKFKRAVSRQKTFDYPYFLADFLHGSVGKFVRGISHGLPATPEQLNPK